jgi:hypothetical protein
MKRHGKHRLSLDIPINFHQEVRDMAKARNISMTSWIIMALMEKIIRERQRD